MSKSAYVAFDLGAESGRAMLATLDAGRVSLTECHRFANRPQRLPSGLHWSLMELWRHLQTGLRKAGEAARDQGVTITSLGVDTWGVDMGLLGQSGALLGLPFAYRSEQFPTARDAALQIVDGERLYAMTGIQPLPFNTLFQFFAAKQAEPGVLEQAARLLCVPDLLHYFFTGVAVNEATIASTTGMVDPNTGGWHTALLEELGLPTHPLGQIVDAGTAIGPVLPAVLEAAGIEPGDTAEGGVQCVVPGAHDTASAVAAVPVPTDNADGEGDWAYLSSGTWSLLGAELDRPHISPEAQAGGFTNERGVAGRIRFLKNIAGLWLVQQTRADFAAAGQDYDYVALTQMAAEAEPFRTLIDPDHAPLASPGSFREKLAAYAEATGQPAPETPGQCVRACLESLALAYRATLAELDAVLGRDTRRLYLVGGGGQNQLLDQMTADAIDRPVYVGPYEATAIGNALTQAMGAGRLDGLSAARAVVRESFEIKRFDPINPGPWDLAADRLTGFAKNPPG